MLNFVSASAKHSSYASLADLEGKDNGKAHVSIYDSIVEVPFNNQGFDNTIPENLLNSLLDALCNGKGPWSIEESSPRLVKFKNECEKFIAESDEKNNGMFGFDYANDWAPVIEEISQHF